MPSKLAALPKVTDYKANEVDQNAQALADLTAEQEALIQFPSFTPEDAWTIGSTIRETFLESYSGNGTLGVVIHIETFTGHRLFSNAVGNPATVGPENWWVMRGGVADVRLWVQAKTNVVKRFGVSSLRKGRQLAVKGQTAEGNGLHFPEYACHGGGGCGLGSADSSYPYLHQGGV